MGTAVSSVFHSWDVCDIPSLKGKNAFVTGANSGIGYVTALELGRKGAAVYLMCRDAGRGMEAVTKMRKDVPDGSFELIVGDLSVLADVKRVAADFNARGIPLDILVNNAGIMMLPKRSVTVDGFEEQMAANHLGHFALTGQLLPSLLKSANARVVSVSSLMAWVGNIKAGDNATDFTLTDATYNPTSVYGNSKLANLLFMKELGRRYPTITAVAAHPGGTTTNLQKHAFGGPLIKMVLQKPAWGALPSLRAATEVGIQSGAYYGPWVAGSMGSPSNFSAILPPQARDASLAGKLWAGSVAATKVSY